MRKMGGGLNPGKVMVLRAVASPGKVGIQTKVASGVVEKLYGDLFNELTPKVGHTLC